MEKALQQPPLQAPLQHPPPPTLCPASKLSHLKESLNLEHQLLRVPFEHYKKTIPANQPAVEKEVSSVISGVADASDSTSLPKDDAVSISVPLFPLCKASSVRFEFHLKLQEFIELVRTENNMRAISYARKCLAPWGATHMKELQPVMETLPFESNIDRARYYSEDDCTKEDPLSQESFRRLASPFPYSKQQYQ